MSFNKSLYFSTIFAIFLIGSLAFNPYLNPNVPNAFAQGGITSDIRGDTWENIQYSDGTGIVTTGLMPYVFDSGSGSYVPYILSSNSTHLLIDSKITPIAMKKSDCTITVLDNSNLISTNPQVVIGKHFYSIAVKQVGQPWIEQGSRNIACTYSTSTNATGLYLTIQRTQTNWGTLTSTYSFPVNGKPDVFNSFLNNNPAWSTNHKIDFVAVNKNINLNALQINSTQLIPSSASGNGWNFTNSDLKNNNIAFVEQNSKIFSLDQNAVVNNIKNVIVNYNGTGQLNVKILYGKNANVTLEGQTVSLDPTWGYSTGVFYAPVTSATTGSSCGSPSTVSTTTYGITIPDQTSATCNRLAVQYTLPSSLTSYVVDNVKAQITTSTPLNARNVNIVSDATHPSSDTATQLWNGIGSGATYSSAYPSLLFQVNNATIDLGATAVSDLQTKLSGGNTTFAIGLMLSSETRDSSVHTTTFGNGNIQLLVSYHSSTPSQPLSPSVTRHHLSYTLNWNTPNSAGSSAIKNYNYYSSSFAYAGQPLSDGQGVDPESFTGAVNMSSAIVSLHLDHIYNNNVNDTSGHKINFTTYRPTVVVTSGSPTITTSGGNTIYQFTSNGTIKFNQAVTAKVLVVGGKGTGSGDGSGAGGAGGAGGYKYSSSFAISTGTYSVTVGTGTSTYLGHGTSSTFSTITEGGGGNGGQSNANYNGGNGGSPDGSGGGGYTGTVNTGTGGAGTGTGHAGGSGSGGACENGGGGGGSSGVGATGNGACYTGTGGAGTANSITGSSVTYAAGGQGGAGTNSYGGDSSAGIVIISIPTPVGTAISTTTGIFNNATKFGVGGGSFMNTTTNKIPTGTNPISLSLWSKFVSTSTPLSALGYKTSTAKTQFLINGTYASILSNNQYLIQCAITRHTSSWNYDLFTYDGTTAKIYNNGTLACSNTSSIGISTPTNNNYTIGIDPVTNSNFFNGTIDEYDIFGKVVSSTDASNIYKRGNTPFVYVGKVGVVNSVSINGLTPVSTPTYYRINAINSCNCGNGTFSNAIVAQTLGETGSFRVMDYLNTTAITTGLVKNTNSSASGSSSLNGTGWGIFTNNLYGNQNITDIDSSWGGNIVIGKHYNVSLNNNFTKVYNDNEFAMHCASNGGSSTDVILVMNDTNGARQTWSQTPTCDANNVISGIPVETGNGNDPNTYSTIFMLKLVNSAYTQVSSASYGGTTVTTSTSGGVVTSGSFVVGTGLQTVTKTLTITLSTTPLPSPPQSSSSGASGAGTSSSPSSSLPSNSLTNPITGVVTPSTTTLGTTLISVLPKSYQLTFGTTLPQESFQFSWNSSSDLYLTNVQVATSPIHIAIQTPLLLRGNAATNSLQGSTSLIPFVLTVPAQCSSQSISTQQCANPSPVYNVPITFTLMDGNKTAIITSNVSVDLSRNPSATIFVVVISVAAIGSAGFVYRKYFVHPKSSHKKSKGSKPDKEIEDFIKKVDKKSLERLKK